MKQSRIQWLTLVAALAAIMLVGIGCQKKAAPPPPPPPPPPAPTASLTANPNSIERGQSTTLSWRTENATEITIDGVGTVEASGSRSVTPTESTTYRLAAKGAGGQQEATARVTVTEPPAPPPAQAAPGEEELFAQNVRDVFFDYDKYDIRPEAQQTLAASAEFLKQHANIRFTVEGHCDERGSTEYNLALGDNRANSVKQALVQLGVGADRIRTISYGKEKPFCTESNEQCWQQNRRGHFVFQR